MRIHQTADRTRIRTGEKKPGAPSGGPGRAVRAGGVRVPPAGQPS
ncbi:hypothetical protein C7S14_6085 [Burkholderia cepacia]|nr:hypothetical protein C7S14_6085 [Burkholderia cepacia]